MFIKDLEIADTKQLKDKILSWDNWIYIDMSTPVSRAVSSLINIWGKGLIFLEANGGFVSFP